MPPTGTKPTETVPAAQPRLVKTQGTDMYRNVHCALQDKAGNLWFGTTGEGIYRYDGTSFINFTEKDGLSHNYVWSVLEDNTGNLWFGTADGACRYDGKTFTRFSIAVIKGGDPSSYNPLKPKVKVDSYGNPSGENTVWNILQDRAGKLWFGTSDGIYCYDGKTFSPFARNDSIRNEAGNSMHNVERILEDKNGNIWFGGRSIRGVFRFDGKDITRLTPDGKNWAWPDLEDNDGNIWFSNWGGMWRYDGKSFSNFTKKEGSCHRGITCILEDKSGNIWSGSDDDNGGLCRYDGKGFLHLTTKDGLVNNAVWTILEDRSGNLWVGTRNTGLCRYDGKTFTILSE